MIKKLVFVLALLASGAFHGSPLSAADEINLSYATLGGAVALYAAIERGYFQEEGLEPAPRAVSPEDLSALVAAGEIQGGEIDYRLYLVKGIGATAGLYSGFLELWGREPEKDAQIKIASVANGSAPAVAAARELKQRGIDTVKDVVWLEVPEKELAAALDKGEATLFARFTDRETLSRVEAKGGAHGAHGSGKHGDKSHEGASHGSGDHGNESHEGASHGSGDHGNKGHEGDSHGSKEHGGEGHEASEHGAAERLAGGRVSWNDEGRHPLVYSARALLPKVEEGGDRNPHAGHTSAHHFFVSFVFVSRDLYEKDPERAAALSRAWIRGSAWVSDNKEAAAALAAAKGLASEEEARSVIFSSMWMPGVRQAVDHLKVYIHEWVQRGIFPANADEKKIFDSLFIPALPGVN
ncbi:MAG: hypothetical protein LBR53_00950 [Deltaproteobacteria bacterium]|jgi:hypothetical protein|nr:hypothetical protein [Deltaproteobacteria bacterium]